MRRGLRPGRTLAQDRRMLPSVARRRQRHVWIVGVLACLALPQRLPADRVVLKHGDILTGKVLELHAGTLVLATRYAGDVSITADFIESIETDRPFTVHTDDGRAFTGTLTAKGDDLRIETAAGDTDTISLEEVREITPPYDLPSTWRWFADANFGADIRMRTDDEREVRLDTSLVGEWGLYGIEMDAEVDREHEDGELTDAEYELFLRGKRVISGPWSIVVFSRFEHDRSEDLELRISTGPALSYRVLDTARDRLRLEGGPAYLMFDYDGYPLDHVAIGRIALVYTALRLAQRLRVEHEDSLIDSLKQPEKYMARSDTHVTWRVAGSYTVGAMFRAQFATEAAPDIDEQDLQLMLTFGYQGGDLSLKP